MSDYSTLYSPFGFEQGDALIVCKDSKPETLRASAKKLKVKGFYIGYGAMIGGRRFDKVVFDISGADMGHAEFVVFWRWVTENVWSCVSPRNEFLGVSFV